MIATSPPTPAHPRIALNRSLLLLLSVAVAWLSAVARLPAAERPHSDAAHGDRLYAEQCSLCHGGVGEGGRGPDLRGVLGRKVAATGFGYSAALKQADWTWTAERLQAFLAQPQRMAPGTTMTIRVADAADRADLVAFLTTLQPVRPPHDDTAGMPGATGVFGGWHDDAPGKVRHIRPSDLPAPTPETSVSNPPTIVPRPANAWPKVPPGFTVSVFARGVDAPRIIRTAPNGDVFAAESVAGRIVVLRPDASGRKATQRTVFASGLVEPFGMAFVPAGPHPQWLYVGESNRIVRYAYHPGDTMARSKPEVVVARISPTYTGHSARDIALSRDGRWLYVGVGSSSNLADGMSTKTLAAAQAYDRTHGFGAAWDSEEDRAQVHVYSLDGKQARTWATGIRNCAGIAVQPGTGDAWCSTNERDRLGNNLVPDYVTRVPDGAFFGWPWWYIGDHEDPRLADQRPDLRGHIRVPDVLLQPHAASLGIAFAPHATLPPAWRGSAFVAEHGSWNRANRTGSKLIRIPVDAKGVPTGVYEDVMTGFVVDDTHVWGRLVGVTPAKDGALLVSDDAGGVIWRLAYGEK